MTAYDRTGWRQVGACLFLLAACGMIASTFSIVAVPLSQEFKPSRMVLMLAMTAMSAATAFLSPLIGNLMDRASVRTLMFIGAASVSCGFLALSFVGSFIQVIAVYGLFMAPANVLIGPLAATVLLSRWFVERRGRALGIALAGISIGGFVFPPIMQALLEGQDWRGGLRILALILAACTVPAALLIVNRPADRGLKGEGTRVTEAVPGAAEPARPSSRAILSDPTFWLIAAVFAVVMAGMKGMVTNLAPIAIDEGIDAEAAALLISMYAAGGFFAKFAFAAFADRAPPRALLRIALFGYAAGMACLIWPELGYGMIAAGVVLIGFFGGFVVPLQSFLVPRIFGGNVVGRASGLLNMVVLLALLLSPPVFGLIYDLTGDYDAIFIAFAGLTLAILAAAVPFLRLHLREGGEESPAAELETSREGRHAQGIR